MSDSNLHCPHEHHNSTTNTHWATDLKRYLRFVGRKILPFHSLISILGFNQTEFVFSYLAAHLSENPCMPQGRWIRLHMKRNLQKKKSNSECLRFRISKYCCIRTIPLCFSGVNLLEMSVFVLGWIPCAVMKWLCCVPVLMKSLSSSRQQYELMMCDTLRCHSRDSSQRPGPLTRHW